MDLENQKRVKALAGEIGKEHIVVILGGADPEASGLIAETVIAGDPAFAGALTGIPLGLPAYHILEPEIKQEIDPAVYEANVGMMEMVLPVADIVKEVSTIRGKLLS
ncbi:MAG: glycine/sarcosine/betaine reductase complex protein A [Spirochaetes bacterium RBG_13_68_11]|nr:MAG: glycine/sarcosine/betaine reductase complex protein A [Spirochaetes bacterium RBG_13_68_11]